MLFKCTTYASISALEFYDSVLTAHVVGRVWYLHLSITLWMLATDPLTTELELIVLVLNFQAVLRQIFTDKMPILAMWTRCGLDLKASSTCHYKFLITVWTSKLDIHRIIVFVY